MPTWKEKLHPERFEGMSGKMAAIVGYICEETGSNVTDLVESALLSEITIGPTVAKTAALGILLKITQLNRTVVQPVRRFERPNSDLSRRQPTAGEAAL